MTIVQLEYLLAVANHGSFAIAAKHCFVTQPALSMQIGRLEDELGVILLDRSKKPIVATDLGAQFLESARKTVKAFYGTKETIQDLKGEFSGTLRIGIIPTISPYLAPGLVMRLAKRYPNVKLEIMDMYTGDIVDALSRDMLDIAILSGGQSDVKITETELFDDKLYMYVSCGNELYGRKSVVVEDIDVRKLLILSKGNCLRNQTLRLCKARKSIELQYDFISCSLETLMHTADATGGTTIIPGMAIGYIPEDKRDRIVKLGKNGACRKISMAVGRTFVRTSLIEAVRKAVMDTREELSVAEFLLP